MQCVCSSVNHNWKGLRFNKISMSHAVNIATGANNRRRRFFGCALKNSTTPSLQVKVEEELSYAMQREIMSLKSWVIFSFRGIRLDEPPGSLNESGRCQVGSFLKTLFIDR